MKKKISIIVPAYNEEENVVALLSSIFLQKNTNFVINEILLLLDGCSDETYVRSKSLDNKKIKIINGKKRIGKSARINQGFQKATSEIIVLLDGDVRLFSKYTLSHLVACFLAHKNVGLVSGRAIPDLGNTFIEKAIYTSIKPYEELIDSYNAGNNIFACKGVLLAVSRKFAKQVMIPNEIFANDAYLYFSCLQKGYSFRYAKKATVLYYLPKTISDHIKQNSRFIAGGASMEHIFGDIVTNEFRHARPILIKKLIKQFIHFPLESTAIFLLNTYCRILLYINSVFIIQTWSVASSTKRKNI